MQEIDSFAMKRLHTIEITGSIESLCNQMSRQHLQAGRLEACSPCACEHGRVDICGGQRNGDIRTGTRNFKIPDELKRIDFLAGSATGGSNPRISPLSFGARCDIG